jgi:hypothetical protein
MSAIKLSTPSSGSISLSPADTASNLTITVPAVTGTMLTDKYAGTVLQVVNATYSTLVSNSTSTYADTGLTATITPKFATSKILVIACNNGLEKTVASGGSAVNLRLLRDSTTISTFVLYASYTNSLLTLATPSGVVNFLDSPATTSAVTYKTQFSNPANTASARVQSNGDMSTITLMEIAQ